MKRFGTNHPKPPILRSRSNEIEDAITEIDLYQELYEQALEDEEFHPDSGTFQTINRESYPTPAPMDPSDHEDHGVIEGFQQFVESVCTNADPATPEEKRSRLSG
jgi:hypothetical protein